MFLQKDKLAFAWKKNQEEGQRRVCVTSLNRTVLFSFRVLVICWKRCARTILTEMRKTSVYPGNTETWISNIVRTMLVTGV